MPVTVKIITPFYNDNCGTPPPFPCMLTDQLKLFGKIPPSTSLLADEVLPATLTGTGAIPSSVKPVSRYQSPEPATTYIHVASPYPQRAPKFCLATPKASTPSGDDSFDSTLDSESTLSSLSLDDSDSEIPKPPGEPGRPGHGGYNLETTPGWKQKAYSKLKKFMYVLINEHLDVVQCMSAQNPALLKLVREKATERFPDLKNYCNCWPVNDMVMMHLKYTSSCAR